MCIGGSGAGASRSIIKTLDASTPNAEKFASDANRARLALPDDVEAF
jgi:hypothetical protein